MGIRLTVDHSGSVPAVGPVGLSPFLGAGKGSVHLCSATGYHGHADGGEDDPVNAGGVGDAQSPAMRVPMRAATIR